MVRSNADEFRRSQKDQILRSNAEYVVTLWRDEFRERQPHYICEFCSFVSDKRNHFEVDHVVPVARGGTRDRASLADHAAIRAGDLDALMRVGLNAQVLCVGCNQAKKTRQFIPPGAGYAYVRHSDDRNPDHVHNGRPTVGRLTIEQHPEPYSVRRYQRRSTEDS